MENSTILIRGIVSLAIFAFIGVIVIVSAINVFVYKGWKRWYWLSCSVVSVLALAVGVWVSAYPPGRHPYVVDWQQVLGMAVRGVYVGMFFSLAGLVVVVCQRWRRKRMKR